MWGSCEIYSHRLYTLYKRNLIWPYWRFSFESTGAPEAVQVKHCCIGLTKPKPLTGLLKTGYKIITENETTNSFAAATPTYVKMCVRLTAGGVDNGGYGNGEIYLGLFDQLMSLGNKPSGSVVAANTEMKLRYKNNSNPLTTREFAFIIQYYY